MGKARTYNARKEISYLKVDNIHGWFLDWRGMECKMEQDKTYSARVDFRKKRSIFFEGPMSEKTLIDEINRREGWFGDTATKVYFQELLTQEKGGNE